MKLILNLRTTLFLAFGAIALVPVLSLSLWIQSTTYTRIIDQVEEKHLLLAKHLSNSLDRYILSLESLLNASLFFQDAEHEANHSHLMAFGGSFERMGVKLIVEISGNKDCNIVLAKKVLNRLLA